MPAWLLLLPIIAVNVCASLLLKSGASRPPSALLLNVASLYTFFGLACFGLGGILYAWILRYVPLSIAQALLAMQYGFTVLGAWLILGEKMDWIQALGFGLIGIGVACVLCRQGA